MRIKVGDTQIHGGTFDTRVAWYAGSAAATPTLDCNGSPVTGTPQNQAVLFTEYVNLRPFGAQELAFADRQIGEIWATITVRWKRMFEYREGMFAVVLRQGPGNGEKFEVRGPREVDFGRSKIELTCRLLR